MFQLVMSTIHDEAIHEKWDSDSCVGTIEDGLLACQAFTTYVQRLSDDFGVTFVMGESTDQTILAAWAPADFMGRHATIYVELQRVKIWDNLDDIMHGMRTHARFTNQIQPSTDLRTVR